MWRFAIPVLALPSLTAIPKPAMADDAVVIKVRGRSQLRLREVSRRPDGKSTFHLTLRLQLSDGLAKSDAESSESGDDRAFADRLVSVELRGGGETISLGDRRTGDDGVVTFERDGVPPETYTVFASYRGDELRDATRGVFAIDVGRQPTQVRIMAPPRITLSDELPLRLALSSAGAPIDGMVTLVLGSHRQQVTLSQGYGERRLPGRGLGKAGEKVTLLAQFAGDRLFAKTETKHELLIQSQSVVALQVVSEGASHELPQGSRLTALGGVRDEEGPLPGELVELEALGDESSAAMERTTAKRNLGHAETDAQGRFEIVVPALMLPAGATLLSAHVFPRRSHILPGRSPELAVQVLPPEPISVLYFLLPLVITGTVLLGWVLGKRLFVWLRELLQAFRLRHALPEPALPMESSLHSSIELRLGEPGVRLTQQRRLSGLRRAVEFSIDGQVVDATFGTPVAGAIAVFADGSEGSEPQHTITVLPSGTFATPQLHTGRYQLRISAPGYLSQQFLATVPHRGEYRQVVVRIEPLRARLLQEWRRVAEGILGEAVVTETPRELLLRLSPGTPQALLPPSQQKLATLTSLVEQAYYSPRICTPEMLVSAAQLADAILTLEKSTSSVKAADLRSPLSPRPLVQQPRT